MEYASKSHMSNKPNGQQKSKNISSGEYDDNTIKKLENKIVNYVDKKLAQLNLDINKLNESFSINSYFEQKEKKMKQFKNIPYINKRNNYAKEYSEETYDNLINDIYKEYKELK